MSGKPGFKLAAIGLWACAALVGCDGDPPAQDYSGATDNAVPMPAENVEEAVNSNQTVSIENMGE